MLRLLLGRAGAGKTDTCLREAAAALQAGGPDGPPLVLLAPEQATYQLERAVLERLADGAAVVRLQVLSFRRLARRVLEEAGGLARPHLGEAGRRMLLRALLRERRSELRAFAATADRPGMAAALARQLGEFEAYAVEPGDLRAAAEAGGRATDLSDPPAAGAARPGGLGAAADRLHDLALLWEAYRERLGPQAADPGSDLAAAAGALPVSALAGAQVWVDGFAGFTPREEGILASLLAADCAVTVTLCLDGREPLGPAEEDADHPFAPTRRTLRRLLALRPSARLECLDGRGRPGRFEAGGDIARLEVGLWAEPPGHAGSAERAGDADEGVSVVGNGTAEAGPGTAGDGAGVGQSAVEASSTAEAGAGTAGDGAGVDKSAVEASGTAEAGAGTAGDGAGVGQSAQGAAAGAGVIGGPSGGGAGSCIFFHVAPDAPAEVAAAADEIDRLCREEGYRHREIAVIVRDMEAYHDLIAPALGARGVPVFVDRKRAAGPHPALATLAAALEVIVSGWSLDAVRRLLHTDLCGLGRSAADALENFALAHGVTGPRWRAPGRLSFPPPLAAGEAEGAAAERARLRTEARMHQLRVRLARPLGGLERALYGGADDSEGLDTAHQTEWTGPAPPRVTGREAALALYRFLEAVKAPTQVAEWARAAEADGRKEEADWHRLCWQAAMGLLEQMALALGPDPVTPPDVLAAIEAGVEDLTVGLVPPRLDQVLCGAVERSRHPELRAAFVLGMADGAFPAPPAESPLLGDADREALRTAGVELGPTAEERLLSERYLGYIALTRARERLYLSHPGGPGPSDLFRRVQEVVGHARPWPACAEPTARRGLAALAADVALHWGMAREKGAAPDAAWEAARVWLQAQPEGAEALLAALSGRRPELDIGSELAGRLYPEVWTASRLETAAGCAFQHFARYGLRLRRREVAEVDPGHVGELLHAALASFVGGLLQDRRDAAEVGEDEAAARAGAALEAAAAHVLGRLPAGAARGPLLVRAAGRDLTRAVRGLLAHARAGAYRPAAAEVDFEQSGLRGRIDRVDEALAADGSRHVRIVDYKTGAARFTLEGFVHGLDVAPALYLTAAAADGGAQPGGCFVMPVRDELGSVAGPHEDGPAAPRLQGLAPRETEAAALHERALDGSVTGVRRKKDGEPYAGSAVADPEDFDLLRRALGRRVDRLRIGATGGGIATNPWRRGRERACDRCEFLEVCGFDPGGGDRYRILPPLKVSDAWAVLRSEEGVSEAGEGVGGDG